ncbi:uncharacterized protein LOC144104690 isoform X2 [Amblyomma americanum]
MRDIDTDELLKREVRCWNEGSDCMAVLPASKIAQHFQRECLHHSIRCPRCSATILCSDVCSHLESECCTAATPAGSGCEGDSDHKDETALLTTFMQSLEAQAGELKAVMEQVLLVSCANSDRLNEVGHVINNCQESLRKELRQGIISLEDRVRQEVSKGTTEQRDCLQNCSDEIATFSEETRQQFIANSSAYDIISNRIHALEKAMKDEFAKAAREKRDKGWEFAEASEGATEQAQEISNAVSRMKKVAPKPPGLQASVCEFFVKGVKSLEEEARSIGFTAYDSDMIYLRGYCMSPGIWLARSRRFTKLSARLHLHKGDADDAVQWPFRQRIRLRVMHPKGAAERELVVRPFDLNSSLQRPEDGQFQYALLSENYLPLEDLIRDGYVQADQFRVKFELLP